MKIEVLYVRDCPNHALALQRLREILSPDSFNQHVCEILVKDTATAQTLKFRGSPTIRINGRDVEPASHDVGLRRDAPDAFGLMCRIYSDGGGAPSEVRLRAAIETVRGEGASRG